MMFRLSRMPARAVISLCFVVAGACARSMDKAAEARALETSVAASEALMLAFRDSVRGTTEQKTARRAMPAPPIFSTDTLNACTDPLPVSNVRFQTTSIFILELPPDFKMTRDGEAEMAARDSDYATYKWKADDGSTVTVEPDFAGDYHYGGGAYISSECDIDVRGRRVHVDLGNATGEVPNRIVNAHFDLKPYRALTFVGRVFTVARQAELLRAVRSIRVTSRWGAGH